MGVFLPPLPLGDWKVPPPIRPTPAPPGPNEGNRSEEGDKNVPPSGCPMFFSRKKKGLSVGLLRPIAHHPCVALGSVLVLPAISAVGCASCLLPPERGLSLTMVN